MFLDVGKLKKDNTMAFSDTLNKQARYSTCMQHLKAFKSVKNKITSG